MNVFCTHILRFGPGAIRFRFANIRNSSTLDRNCKIRPQARFLDPSPPLSTYTSRQNVIHMIKWTRPSASVFASCKRSKTGRWEGLGTRLYKQYTITKDLGSCTRFLHQRSNPIHIHILSHSQTP